MDHYKHPRNFGELPDADFSYEIDNPLCGDKLKLQIKFKPVILNGAKRSEESQRLSTRSFDSVPLTRDSAQDDVVADARFTGTGCAISTASASLFTEYLKNKTRAELLTIDENEIYKLLGVEINPGRAKCVLLPLFALKEILKSSNPPLRRMRRGGAK